MITDQEVEAGARAWCLALDIDPDYPHGGKADAAPWWKVEAPRIRAALEAVRALRPAGEVAKYHLIFDGFPGPDGPRFIELENDAGHSIGVGEWVDDPRHPGWAQLVLPVYASAIISALAHVSGTPKTEHVASDMLLATPTAANASEGDGWIRDRVPEKDGFYLCWTECPPQSHPLQSIRWRSRDSYWLTSWPIIAWRDAPAPPDTKEQAR